MNKNSTLVWAAKYELKVKIPGDSGAYDLNGTKVLVKEGLMPRNFVESRNEQHNNELFVIDEEKTAELDELREANLAKSKEKEKAKDVSVTEALQAIASGMSNLAGSKESEEVEEKPKRKRGPRKKIEADNKSE
jgi:hypothetical protein